MGIRIIFNKRWHEQVSICLSWFYFVKCVFLRWIEEEYLMNRKALSHFNDQMWKTAQFTSNYRLNYFERSKTYNNWTSVKLLS